MTGIIKSYSYEKECGYINAEDGKEYFFDISYLKNKDDKMRIKIGLPVILFHVGIYPMGLYLLSLSVLL